MDLIADALGYLAGTALDPTPYVVAAALTAAPLRRFGLAAVFAWSLLWLFVSDGNWLFAAIRGAHLALVLALMLAVARLIGRASASPSSPAPVRPIDE